MDVRRLVMIPLASLINPNLSSNLSLSKRGRRVTTQREERKEKTEQGSEMSHSHFTLFGRFFAESFVLVVDSNVRFGSHFLLKSEEASLCTPIVEFVSGQFTIDIIPGL